MRNLGNSFYLVHSEDEFNKLIDNIIDESESALQCFTYEYEYKPEKYPVLISVAFENHYDVIMCNFLYEDMLPNE